MTEVINYMIRSSVCLTVFYLVFRWTMKKEALFTINRYLLLATVIVSLALPLIQKPTFINNRVNVKVFPTEKPILMPDLSDAAIEITNISPNRQNVNEQQNISYEQTIFIVYIVGCITMLLLVISGIIRLLFLLTTTKVYRKKGFKLALVNRPISPMSFGRYIIMSKLDYKENRTEILNHEKAHLKFKHSLDILLIEVVKIIQWFNPIIYLLKTDIKEIQEFQVDKYIIDSGIDSKSYQLLMIKKCVGSERYALANSFNHCQIKNRIVMMNNQKTRKGKSWKVAIFLPVAALMLMAFGSKRDEVPIVNSIVEQSKIVQQKVWTEVDFKSITDEELRNRKEHDFFNGIKWNIVLMNKYSKIMVDGIVTPLEDVGRNTEQMIQSDLKRYQINNGNDGKSILSFIVFIRKDIAANKEDFNGLINIIANGFISARNKLSSIKYNLDYERISSREKEIINSMIPMNVYIVNPPKEIKGNAGPPPPPSTLTIKKDGFYLGKKKYSLKELEELIEFNTKNNTKVRFILKIDKETFVNQIEEVKQALKDAEIVRIEEIKPPPGHILINLKKDGIYFMDNLVLLDELKKIVLKNLSDNPNQIVSIKAANDVEKNQVDAVKKVLREAKVLNINYSTNAKE